MKHVSLSLLCGALFLVSAPLMAQPAVEECAMPGTFITQGAPFTEIITIADDVSIVDLQVKLVITHTWIGDLIVDVTSPALTTVRLTDGSGGSTDNILVTFTDQGNPFDGGQLPDGLCMQPEGPGVMADFVGQSTQGDWALFVEDSFGGDDGTLDEWCVRGFDVAPPPCPVAVENLACSSASGSGVIEATWTNPVTYDSINVYVDGNLEANLPGNTTLYTTNPLGQGQHTVTVEGVVAGQGGPLSSCTATVIDAADVDVCTPTPGGVIDTTFPILEDIITVTDSITLQDVQVFVDITHPFIGELTLIVTSPNGTNVTLDDGNGGSADNMNLIFWDLGVPNDSEPYDFGGFMQPSGPGMLADFIGENSAGDWKMTIINDGDDLGTLNDWCFRGFLNSPPFPVENLVCDSASGIGVVDASWTNPVVYDTLNVYVNGVLEASLPGTSTSYSTMPQPVPSDVTVEIEGVIGSIIGPRESCTVTVVLPPVVNASCNSVAGSGIVDATWTNPIAYDLINIYVNGNLEMTVGGTDTMYSTQPAPIGQSVTVCIEGVITALGPAEQVCCSAFLAPAGAIQECSSTGAPLSSTLPPVVETVNFAQSITVGDTFVQLNVTHTWIGDLDYNLQSPLGTVVVLQDTSASGSTDNIDVTFSDAGIPFEVAQLPNGLAMQPQGPGVMADYTGENSQGTWTFTIADTVGGDSGTLDSWCVVLIEACPTPAPTNLTCSESGGNIELAWTINGNPVEHLVFRNGIQIATLAGNVNTYTDPGVPPGSYNYQVIAVDGCPSLPASCSLLFGITDIIFAGEEAGGMIDSVAAVQQALSNAGLGALIVTELSHAAIGQPERLWVMLGTFSDNYQLSDDDGLFLAELNTGDLGLDGTQDQDPTPIYIEGGDTWGFDPQTVFEFYDGIQDNAIMDIPDGGDNLTFLMGADSGFGLSTVGLDAAYNQDQSGNDFTDELIAADVNPDLGGPQAGVIWTFDDAGSIENTGVYYNSSFAAVIANSHEFGGYTGDQDALLGLYVTALGGGGPVTGQFSRGDVNQDGTFDISDLIKLLGELFSMDPPASVCPDSADLNDDGGKDISDAIYGLGTLFSMGPNPLPPFPGCGTDPTPDGLPDCESHAACP